MTMEPMLAWANTAEATIVERDATKCVHRPALATSLSDQQVAGVPRNMFLLQTCPSKIVETTVTPGRALQFARSGWEEYFFSPRVVAMFLSSFV